MTPERVKARLAARAEWPSDEDPLAEARAEARVESLLEGTERPTVEA